MMICCFETVSKLPSCLSRLVSGQSTLRIPRKNVWLLTYAENNPPLTNDELAQVLAAEANSIIAISGHSDRHDSSLLSIP
jgi:hypothetical protein